MAVMAFFRFSGHSACLELVLMKLSKQFPELGTMLMKQLLKCPREKGRKRGPLVSVATVELIYQLGKKQDSSYEDRYGEPSVDWAKLVLHHRGQKSINNVAILLKGNVRSPAL